MRAEEMHMDSLPQPCRSPKRRPPRSPRWFHVAVSCLVAGALAIVVSPIIPLSSRIPNQSWAVEYLPDLRRCGSFTSAVAESSDSVVPVVMSEVGASCDGSMLMPVSSSVLSTFRAPTSPWMSGHRGVDLAAVAGQTIVAPADGIIGFSGRVAGKDVVTVRHGNVVSSFEPASSDLSVGDTVVRGQAVGTVSRGSDHCDDACLHWGLRTNDGEDYVDPLLWTSSGGVVLKPAMEKAEDG